MLMKPYPRRRLCYVETGVIIGVIGAVLTVGVLALVLWKVCAVLHDRREYARFLRSKDQAKWSTVSRYDLMMFMLHVAIV